MKLYASVATRCGGGVDADLQEVQGGLAGLEGVYAGPNTDVIGTGADWRFDGCHFTQGGWDRVAGLWLEALE
jgi:hypothetical protein